MQAYLSTRTLQRTDILLNYKMSNLLTLQKYEQRRTTRRVPPKRLLGEPPERKKKSIQIIVA